MTDKEEFKIIKAAAEQGCALAQYYLGDCYMQNPKAKQQDYEEAVEWFRKAAQQGNSKAQNYLGICYYLGKGVEKDYKEAGKWIGLAAEQGDSEAQDNLNFFKNKVNHE